MKTFKEYTDIVLSEYTNPPKKKEPRAFVHYAYPVENDDRGSVGVVPSEGDKGSESQYYSAVDRSTPRDITSRHSKSLTSFVLAKGKSKSPEHAEAMANFIRIHPHALNNDDPMVDHVRTTIRNFAHESRPVSTGKFSRRGNPRGIHVGLTINDSSHDLKAGDPVIGPHATAAYEAVLAHIGHFLGKHKHVTDIYFHHDDPLDIKSVESKTKIFEAISRNFGIRVSEVHNKFPIKKSRSMIDMPPDPPHK